MELRPYQEQDALWLCETPRAYLAADPGLGKSATVLASLTPDRLPALVVAPAYVAKYTWPEEVAKWRPDLRCQVLTSRSEPDPEADIYVISYSILHKSPVTRGSTLVLDEAQYVKTHTSQRSKAARKLATRFDHTVLLSGTPVGNSLADLWHQAKVLDGGERLGRTLGAFRTEYMTVERRDPRTGIVWKWGEKPGARDKAFERMSDVMVVRRLEDHLSLPERMTQVLEVRLGRAESRAYKELAQEAVTTLDSGQDLAAFSAAAVSTKLRQVCAGLVLDEGGDVHELGRSKLEALRSVVQQVCGPDLDSGQVVVWNQFRAEEAALKAAFPGKVADKHTVSEWLGGEYPILVAHPASLGAGVNLQIGGCHHEVVLSQTWSLDQWVQSQARLLRSGQQHTVVTYVLEAVLADGKPTVDRRVRRALDEKEDLLSALRVALSAV